MSWLQEPFDYLPVAKFALSSPGVSGTGDENRKPPLFGENPVEPGGGLFPRK